MSVLSDALLVEVPLSTEAVLSNTLTVAVPVASPGSGTGTISVAAALAGAGETPAPSMPTGLALGEATTTTLTLAWTDQSGGTAWHRIYFRLNGSGDPYEIGAEVPPATVSAQVGGLASATAYEVRATAFIGASESEFTAAITPSTLSGSPTGTGLISVAPTLAGSGQAPAVAVTQGTGLISATAVLSGSGSVPGATPQGTGTITVGGRMAGLGSRPSTVLADLNPELMALIL